MSGQLDSIIEWLKSNTTKFFVYNYVRVEPTDSDGYFGNSSFDILWNLSSASYGWIMLRSDNPKSVLFGRLVDGNAQWDIPVFKSDIPNLYYSIKSSIINNPTEVIKEQWISMPDGYYLCEMSCGSAYIAIIQRIGSGQHGSVIIHGYGTGLPVYLRRVNGEWI